MGLIAQAKLQKNHELPHLVHNRIEYFPAQEVARNGKFAIEQANLGVIRILHIEARKVEHRTCQSFLIKSAGKERVHHTIINLTPVCNLLCFAERMHEIRQARGVKMSGMVGQQCPHKLAKAQIQE